MIKSNIKKQFECDINKLWDIVTNNEDYQWRSDLSKIEITDETHFIEYAKNDFPTHFTITSKKEAQEYGFILENANMQGKWIGYFKQLEDGKTELDFTEEIEVKNPIMRLLAKGYLKKQQEKYMEDLEKKVMSKE